MLINVYAYIAYQCLSVAILRYYSRWMQVIIIVIIHHHLFLKRPFLLRSARVRHLPRYEASPVSTQPLTLLIQDANQAHPCHILHIIFLPLPTYLTPATTCVTPLFHPDSRIWVSILSSRWAQSRPLSAILSQQDSPPNISCSGNQHCFLTSFWCHYIFFEPTWDTLHTRLSCSQLLSYKHHMETYQNPHSEPCSPDTAWPCLTSLLPSFFPLPQLFK